MVVFVAWPKSRSMAGTGIDPRDQIVTESWTRPLAVSRVRSTARSTLYP